MAVPSCGPLSCPRTERPAWQSATRSAYLSRVHWLVGEPAIDFTCGKVADAQLREIIRIALINLFHRKVRLLHLVLAGRHAFGFIYISAHDRAALLHANAKFAGRWLVVFITEAMTDACAIHYVVNEL